MTLCAAWIRCSGETKELIFATDSCLISGEKWNRGIKLFELPRKDCLICFAGSTFRAYPLILNLISSIKFNERLLNPQTDITEILDYLIKLFTDLCSNITNIAEGEDIHNLRADANFLFGGWSWKKQKFCIWKLEYSKEVEGFISKASHIKNNARINIFIGDEIKKAKELFKKEFVYDDEDDDNDSFNKNMDMEPLNVLVNMIRDDSIRSIDGAVQLAKIYQSGSSEFFGVISKGKPTFLGREFNEFNKPNVKYIYQDNIIIENEIPKYINITNFSSDITVFLQKFYDERNGKLKQSNISYIEKQQISSLFKEIAYKEYLKTLSEFHQENQEKVEYDSEQELEEED